MFVRDKDICIFRLQKVRHYCWYSVYGTYLLRATIGADSKALGTDLSSGGTFSYVVFFPALWTFHNVAPSLSQLWREGIGKGTFRVIRIDGNFPSLKQPLGYIAAIAIALAPASQLM